jgi:hypothetical protein
LARRKQFFFEKKNQKTFATLGLFEITRGRAKARCTDSKSTDGLEEREQKAITGDIARKSQLWYILHPSLIDKRQKGIKKCTPS